MNEIRMNFSSKKKLKKNKNLRIENVDASI
jgi:hypothetical protein